jgi:hypothetical protein
VPELSLTARLVVTPVALISSTIRPYLNTIAVLHVPKPLSLVDCTVFEDDFTFLLELQVLNIAVSKLSLIYISYYINIKLKMEDNNTYCQLLTCRPDVHSYYSSVAIFFF